MAAKYPIQYDLRPMGLDEGLRWVTLILENVGDRRLEEMEAKLNSRGPSDRLSQVFEEEVLSEEKRIPADATRSLGRDVLIVHVPEREDQV